MTVTKIGVLGTGGVGQAVATRLAELGYDVVMGAREAGNPKADGWAAATGGRAGTFADAAAHGELLVNATSGMASLAALGSAGPDALAGKVLIDIANPLDFSHGMPPSLAVVNTDSLAEQIQREFPQARVVKALNTMNAEIMVHPELVPGEHHTFVAGDDPEAKAEVVEILRRFGWPAASVLDVGGITSARGLEMYMGLWMSLMGVMGTYTFNIAVVRP